MLIGVLFVLVVLCDAAAALPHYHALARTSNLPLEPIWTAEADQANAAFGFRVASAGDVNGDGFDDVLVGSYWYDAPDTNEGRAFVYLGSASGLSATPAWTAEGDQKFAGFGISVASAGDVNGDGYDDVVIGASGYANGQAGEGRAYVFLGSASGLSPSPAWTMESNVSRANFGQAVAGAGDVNGDGYDDVLVGAPWLTNDQGAEGRAYLYLGSASGLSTEPAWTAEGDQVNARYGLALSAAGDVNGDGFDDVLVGAPDYASPDTWEGRAYLYLGSSLGLSATASWTADGEQAYALFGDWVSTAGDVNHDGFDDVLIGAPWYSSTYTNEGGAFLYLGSASGLPTTAAWFYFGGQTEAGLGVSVGPAGDLNADGFDDVIVGVPGYDGSEAEEGRAYVFLGSSVGLEPTPAWVADGEQAGAAFGRSARTAGDVDANGRPDLLVGADRYTNGELHEGRAFLYRINPSTSVLLSAVSAEVIDGRVRLQWHVDTGSVSAGTVYRREESTNWRTLGHVATDGLGRITLEDSTVTEGRRYGYRLSCLDGTSEVFGGETWVDVPGGYRLSLEGARPNPSPRGFTVAFSFPTGCDAVIEVLDIGGRTVLRQAETYAPGNHVVGLRAPGSLPPGVYLVRLTVGSQSLTKKAIILGW